MEQQTYEQILERMEAAFSERAGFLPDSASDLGIRLRVLAGEIFNLRSGMDWLKRQVFPQTAGGEFLELHAGQKGLSRQGAALASGTLTFSRQSALTYPLTIPLGTICTLEGDEAIRYVTTQAAELDAGALSVTVPAAAEQGGVQANAAAGTVTRMVTPPVGIEAVTNESPFTGGADAETDDQLRARLLQLLRNQSNGANRAFFTNFAMGYDGVYSANTVAAADAAGTVQVYVCGQDGGVPDELLAEIQAGLNAVKEINVTATVANAEEVAADFACRLQPADPYQLSDITAACEAIVRAYAGALQIGEPFVVAQAIQRMMAAGLIENYQLYSYTADVSPEPHQRAVLGTLLLTQMT